MSTHIIGFVSPENENYKKHAKVLKSSFLKYQKVYIKFDLLILGKTMATLKQFEVTQYLI